MAKKRKDGRKEAKYTYKGKRYSIYGSTKAEMDKKWEVKKKELEMNSFTASKDLSVGEYLFPCLISVMTAILQRIAVFPLSMGLSSPAIFQYYLIFFIV